jgi:hypothetical protein
MEARAGKHKPRRKGDEGSRDVNGHAKASEVTLCKSLSGQIICNSGVDEECSPEDRRNETEEFPLIMIPIEKIRQESHRIEASSQQNTTDK